MPSQKRMRLLVRWLSHRREELSDYSTLGGKLLGKELMVEVQLVETDADLKRCYPVIMQLRPNIAEQQFLE